MHRYTIVAIATLAFAVTPRATFAGLVVIDSFDAEQKLSIEDGPPGTTISSTSATTTGIINSTHRDAVLTSYGSAGSLVRLSIDSGSNGLAIYGESNGDGAFSLTYDGDTDPDSLSQSLGADLFDGTNTDIVLEGIDNSTGTTDIIGSITVYKDATNFSKRAFTILAGFTGNGTMSFASFNILGGTGAGDFSSVSAIVIEFDLDGNTNTNFNLERITARGSGGPDDAPLPTPEPASIALFSIGAFALLGFCIIRRRRERLTEMIA